MKYDTKRTKKLFIWFIINHMNKKRGNSENVDKTKLIMKGNLNGYFKTDTKINFKVPKNSTYYKKVFEAVLFPTYNSDKKYYTPAFCLPLIQTMKDQDYIAVHNHKVQQSLKELNEQEIMVPKPRSKHKYCAVCRKYYEEYLDHVQSDSHKEFLANSKYQKAIVHECKKFRTKYQWSESVSMEKNRSVETKINEDENQNSTQSFIEQKKQIINKIHELNELHEQLPQNLLI